jgi:hypothetical protein
MSKTEYFEPEWSHKSTTLWNSFVMFTYFRNVEKYEGTGVYKAVGLNPNRMFHKRDRNNNHKLHLRNT